MRIMVTGGRGQLGHALKKYLTGHDLCLFDVQDFDICQPESVDKFLGDVRPELLINAAAFTDVDGAESRSEEAFRVNATGARVLAQATAGRKIPIVHISTDYVFDGEKREPYVEDDEPNPRSVYGASKLAGEKAVVENNPRYFIVRTAWLFYEVGKNFPKTMISLAQSPQVRVVDDQIGSPTYAPHLVMGLGKLIHRSEYGIYHMAGSGQTSWYGLTKYLYEKMRLQTPVISVKTSEFPRPAPRPPFSALATQHVPAILLPPWEDGINQFAECYTRDIER